MPDMIGHPGAGSPPARKDGPETAHPSRIGVPAQGQTLGKYRIVRRLAKGGMGVVYEAEDTLLRRPVAVKLLPRSLSGNGQALERFLREAQAAARLNHPNVVTVYEINEASGAYYLVMELVEGGSTQELLKARGPLPWRQATRIVADICRGLEAAHAQGLIHRDIKPANILLTADGTGKLADFGLAKGNSIGHAVTAVDQVIGTPQYMSPEQCRAARVDPRSDLYSLGGTYFALLTGKPPYADESPVAVMCSHVQDPVPDPRTHNPQIPEACAKVIARAMAKAPEDRFASATQMLQVLERLIYAASSGTMPVVRPNKQRPAVAPAVPAPVHLEAATVPLEKPVEAPRPKVPHPRPRSRRWALGALAAAPLLGAGLVWGLRGGSHREGPAPGVEKTQRFLDTVPESGLALPMNAPVQDLAISPDGKWLAAVSHEAGVRVWELETGQVRKEFEAHGGIRCLIFAPDSRALVAGTTGKMLIWAVDQEDVSTVPLRGSEPILHSLAFSPDGKVLAMAALFTSGPRKGAILLWDVPNRALAKSSLDLDGAFTCCTFAPEGRILVAGSNRTNSAKWWDLRESQLVREESFPAAVMGLAFAPAASTLTTPAGRWLAVATARGMVFYPAAPDADRMLLKPNQPLTCVACSADSHLTAAGTPAGKILLRNNVTAVWQEMPAHTGHTRKLAFAPDGSILASGGDDQTVRLWSVRHFAG
jgi:serine/threonine protein kinase